ncbi:MAG: hypothetical protein VX278_24115 [Myxococcota bacterium]|nr:hypothetical protein [Myxococcota bacterium]
MQRLYCAFLLSISIGCSSDQKQVTKVNPPPEVVLQFPTADAEIYQGTSYLIQGLASDEFYASDLSSLVVIITANGQTICPDSVVENSGAILCEHSFEQVEDVELIMQVTNNDELSATDSVSFSVIGNEAPSAEIVSPITDGYYYSNYEVNLEALASDAEDASETLIIDWRSSADGDLHTQNANSDGTASYSVQLSQGTHTIQMDVTDTKGRISSDSVEIDVLGENNAPSCAISDPIADQTYGLGEGIPFSGTASDDDIPENLISVTWSSSLDGDFFSGSVDSDGTFSTTVDTLQSGNHTITLLIEDEVGLSCSASVNIIINAAPAVTILSPADNSVFNENEAVEFEGLISDADEDPETLGIQWSSSVDGVFSSTPANSNGETNATAYGLFIGGHTITLKATDANGEEVSESISIQINDLPTEPSVSISPDPAQSDEDLSMSILSDSQDLEGDPISYNILWKQNGMATSNTASTLAASNTIRGDVWSVEVTPNDGYGDGAVGTASVTIGNSPPSIGAVSINPSSPGTNDNVSCIISSPFDNDGDSMVYTYTWTVDGVDVSNNSNSLSSDQYVRGQSVICSVVPSDGYDIGAATSSTATLIANTPPILGQTSLVSDETDNSVAYEASTLTCSPQSSTDADGDSVSYTYAWYVNGTSISVQSQSITGSQFNRDDTVYCEATPNDGVDSGAAVASNSMMISNTAPAVDSASITPNPAYESSTLDCIVGSSSDDDGDTVSYLYDWQVNGAALGYNSTSVTPLTGTNFNKDDSVVCLVTPTDGSDTGEAFATSALIISNSAPSASSVVILPTSAYTNDTLSAEVSGWSDIDSDTEDYLYSWTVNGTEQSTEPSLDPSFFIKGDNIRVSVTPYDGADSGTTLSSSTITILNTPPEAPDIDIIPESPEPGDALECVIVTDSYDADGDTVSYDFQWSINNIHEAAFDGATNISGSNTDHNDIWTCQVTPSDGDVGPAATTSELVLDQTAPEDPVIDLIDSYRNSSNVSLTGTTDGGAIVTIYQNCVNAGQSTTQVVANSAGVFGNTFIINAGDICSYYAVAQDLVGNESEDSNMVTTEFCDPADDFELTTGYGDTCADAINESITLGDNSYNSKSLQGNIIASGDVDWYVVETTQTPLTSGVNYYNFNATLEDGASSYAMEVYRGTCSDLECSTASAITEYSFFAEDDGDGSTHSTPSDNRYCVNGSLYDNCSDFTATYYIKVYRDDGLLDCTHYTLTVSNGYQ